ncbi:MAG: hypothetical protein JXA94_01175 [Parachlamydiales bacterium]|nr:hypothetical protein [Parachlamydiales bacterium]
MLISEKSDENSFYIIPQDVYIVVGLSEVLTIKFLSFIKTFFNLLLFSQHNDFLKNLKVEYIKVSNDEILKEYKKSKSQRSLEEIVFQLPVNKKDSGSIEKNLFAYNLLEMTLTRRLIDMMSKNIQKKDFEELLKNFERTNENHFHKLLSELKNLAEKENTPIEIKKLINQKLLKIDSKRKKSLIIKIIVIAFAIFATSYGIKKYYDLLSLLNEKEKADISKINLDQLHQPTLSQSNELDFCKTKTFLGKIISPACFEEMGNNTYEHLKKAFFGGLFG